MKITNEILEEIESEEKSIDNISAMLFHALTRHDYEPYFAQAKWEAEPPIWVTDVDARMVLDMYQRAASINNELDLMRVELKKLVEKAEKEERDKYFKEQGWEI